MYEKPSSANASPTAVRKLSNESAVLHQTDHDDEVFVTSSATSLNSTSSSKTVTFACQTDDIIADQALHAPAADSDPEQVVCANSDALPAASIASASVSVSHIY